MALGDIYIKFKNCTIHRKELCCLRENLFDKVHHYIIKTNEDEFLIPDGYLLQIKTNTKPEVPEGKFLGYKYQVSNNSINRTYMIFDGPNDLNLFVVDDYEEAVQNFLDQSVQKRGYDNVYTCLTYKDDPDPIFSAEADQVLAWRSQVWRTAQGILNQWSQGQIEQPTIQEVINQLPQLEW